MIDGLWERDDKGEYVDQTTTAALLRHRVNTDAIVQEMGMLHNARAIVCHAGVVATDAETPPNAWCHACGANLNEHSVVVDGHRQMRFLNFTREGRLVFIRSATTNELLHDCAVHLATDIEL